MNTGLIRAICRIAASLAPLAFATHALAGMTQDLASCTAAKGSSSAAACTRVMDSGRLPDEQFWIGHFNRGSGYQRGNEYAKALADFDKAVKLNRGFSRAYLGRGLVHDEFGAETKALADLDRAIELDRGDWSAYYSRATVLRGGGDLDAALADLAKAAEHASNKPQVALLRALIRAERGEYAGARADINKVIADGGSDASGYYARAAVAFAEQRLDAASDDLDRALAAESKFAAAHMLKGRILEAEGDKAGAKERYRKALDLAPDLFDGRHARVIARERLKALGDDVAKPDVALATPRKVGCKRFLPATGMLIEASCGE